MDFAWLIPLLALMTILAGLCVALWSKEATERRKRRADIPNSALAADGDSHRKAP